MKKITLLFCSLAIAAAMQAQVIHVPADYPTIQQGIAAATNGDTILVADGLYYENINFSGKKPLLVASQFIMDGDTNHINNTVIDGSQATDLDHASVVTFATGEDTTSVICGFTLQGGKGTWDMNPDERCGGGIFIGNAGAKIIHNKITGNVLDDTQPVNGQGVHGAGIGSRPYGGQYWVVIEHNRISNNTANTQYDYATGGGIYVNYNTRIAHNIIAYNTCQSTSGESACGAIYNQYISGSSRMVIITDNIIDHNSAGTLTGAATSGAVAVESAVLLFSGNEVTNNTCFTVGYGGTSGLSILDPGMGCKVLNNVFKDNSCNYIGGALFLFNTDSSDDPNVVDVSNNYFLGNESKNGGAVSSWDIPFTLQNNVFSGNYAELRGGAVFIQKSGTYSWIHLATMINNSFYNNIADLYGGAIYSNKAMPLIFNSIFYGDQSPEGAEIYLNHYLDTLDIAYCDIDPALIYGNVYDGVGNMNDDPLFEDMELLTLQNGSPCIDAGTLYYVCHCGDTHMSPEADILGVTRPQSGEYEIGAYEMLFEGMPEPVSSQQSAVVTYPNPTNGSSQFTVRSSQEGHVKLKIYDVNGREVAVVLDKEMPAGEYTVKYDASGLPAGVYFIQLAVGSWQLANGKLVKY